METAREEELLAMENIFGPEEFRRNETLGGEMLVCAQLPHEFTVIREGERNGEFVLKFLPPLVVDFELPAGYPRHSSPTFRLSCQWLRHDELSKVCKHLDEMWQDTGGEPVLFSWFQFLRDDLLDFLSISLPWEIPCMEEPDLGASLQDTDSRDPRVTSPASTDTDLLQRLLDHDQKMQQKDFEGQSFDCGICFSSKSGLECHRFKGCEHVFCKDCISNVFKIAVEEGRVLRFSCPDTDCNSVATHSEVKALVGEELFGRYDQLLLQKTLDCMTDVVYCPRPNCSSPVVQEPEESWAFCASCVFAFCTKCREGYHGVDKCGKDTNRMMAASNLPADYAPLPKTEEGIRVLWKDYQKGTKQRRQLLVQRYGKEPFLQNVTDALSGQWIETNTKECPSCKVKIQKTEGCNHMMCTTCLTPFCWDCLKILSDSTPHFEGDCSNWTD